MLLLLNTAHGQVQGRIADTAAPAFSLSPDSLGKINQLVVSGYIEPEFQVAQAKGIASFSGGNFSLYSNNRFIIRRGRPRITYKRLNAQKQLLAEVVFEIDGTQRGISINECWGKLYENKWQVFSFSTGMLVRPFGFELSQPTRLMETPERGRNSQTLMRGEVDLGAMVCFEPRNRHDFLQYIKGTLGVFNGQGLTAPGEYDGFKDIIARAALKPFPVLGKKLFLSGGLSMLNGGIVQGTPYVYWVGTGAASKQFMVDSSASNIGQKSPREYYGIDAQLKLKQRAGFAEIRAEYWWGTQTATAGSSETPATLLTEPSYIRRYNGAFFYLLCNIFNERHQLVGKLDWYDPNAAIKGTELGSLVHTTAADIKYTTLGFGYNYYPSDNLHIMLWYDRVANERTALPGYSSDLKDNVFTCRLQFRF